MSDYIDRGLRRARYSDLPTVGALCQDDEGRFARFSIRIDGGRVAEVAFRASSCVTLIAYCEVAAERAEGASAGTALRRLHPADVAGILAQVPAHKRDRARLATRALAAAIVRAASELHQ